MASLYYRNRVYTKDINLHQRGISFVEIKQLLDHHQLLRAYNHIFKGQDPLGML